MYTQIEQYSALSDLRNAISTHNSIFIYLRYSEISSIALIFRRIHAKYGRRFPLHIPELTAPHHATSCQLSTATTQGIPIGLICMSINGQILCLHWGTASLPHGTWAAAPPIMAPRCAAHLPATRTAQPTSTTYACGMIQRQTHHLPSPRCLPHTCTEPRGTPRGTT